MGKRGSTSGAAEDVSRKEGIPVSHRLFTSESVTEGHPDKMADQISDAILDDLLRQDPTSRVAVETMLTTGQVHVAGEVTTNGYADVMGLVRQTVLGIGYDSSVKGFDGESCGISVSLGKQSRTSPKASTTHSRSVPRAVPTRWTVRERAIRDSCSDTHATTPPSSCPCRSTSRSDSRSA